MLHLLDPRVWLIALALLAGSFGAGYFKGDRNGAKRIQAEWNEASATANADARRIETLRQSRVDEALRAAGARQARLLADRNVLRAQSDGLRDDLSAVRLHAAQSLDAATKSVAALADVFEQCSRRYSELAEVADRHASDSLMLQEAWPK